MSYNGSGTFNINSTGQPVVAGTVITASAFNALTADLATGLTTAITKDGQTTTTARIPFAQGINSSLVTDSSSTSTGSIITAGGVGIAKNLYVGVNANVAGTLGVTGVATFSAAPIYSSLTASSAVATDASKGLVSVTNTGTGNNVLGTSPTIATPTITGDASISGLTVGKGGGAVATNTAIGNISLGNNTTGANSTAVGQGALSQQTTGGTNDAFGRYALGSATVTGTGNAGFGSGSLTLLTSGTNNVASGADALYNNSTGGSNTAVGQGSLRSNTTASNNTAVGYQAGYSGTTGNNIACFGKSAGYTNTTGTDNTLIGFHAGYTLNSGGNVALGSDALSACTSGSLNTAVGYSGGNAITTGSKNTILGRYTGNQGGLDIRTASNYVVLSDGDGNPRVVTDNNGWTIINPTTSNATHIGGCALSVYGTNTSSGNQMFAMRNTGATAGKYWYQAVSSANTVFYLNNGSVGVSMTDGATSWSSYSDSRLKNVTGIYTTALADIAQLQPVKFTWKSDTTNKPCVGVIAQSVQSIVPEAIDATKLANADELGDQTEYLSVRYTELIPLMIASIQELKAEFDAYKSTHP